MGPLTGVVLGAGIDDARRADWNFLYMHRERKKEVVMGEEGRSGCQCKHPDLDFHHVEHHIHVL